jgi:D-alanyl-D-alanine carboxypeptidase
MPSKPNALTPDQHNRLCLLAADSDNLYAEVFARTLGAFFTPANQTSSSTLNDGLALIAKVPSAYI